ncbi:MAG TPA: adenylate/guanylate cyclase domain-containing protein [Cyanobacteria bacterium UBA11369]|nr:adenylate/guanylate cyclase domain-containing protein [Cyanobacteria bacterium UBA11371]HBE33126.1 adenylate/guanylate cyclase domain-containing protein [Cyanobacteria bacterium UBA11368]HBE51823.1 adenylate/guanylate cyclase domain-containing protein [Cyanobacteria bacterium UBA11369]
MAAKSWIGRLQRSVSVTYPWIPGAVAAILSVGMWHFGSWKPLERMGYIALFKTRFFNVLPQPSWDERLAIIAIDEASLKKYGQFPWARDRYIQLLQQLQKSPPAAIGFDIKFVESSPVDAQFARAIASTGTVVLARAWDDRGKVLEPVPALADVAANQGHIVKQVDADGITRQATIWVNGPNFSIPSLGLALLEVYNASNPRNPAIIPQPIPSLKMQGVWLNWPGKVKMSASNPKQISPPTYSFVDVVEGRFKARDFANKIVLVGATAKGLEDNLRSPLNLDPPISGVYFHAAVIDNLLNNRLLQLLEDKSIILLLLLLGPITNGILLQLNLRGRLIVAVVLPLIYMGIAAIAFSFYHWWLPIAAPIGTILLTGVGVQLREQSEKQQLMGLFEKHVAPETANLIWEHKEEIIQDGELEAQEMVATVLFMDIRGFTSISEKLPPRELLSWLNQYLDVMSDCIMNHGGVIDKYIGDAIMAVFGIPQARTTSEEIKQDAINAIAASIAMHEKLEELNQQLREEGKPEIQFGIGIHTGTLVAGSIGGSRRLNYSVLGDTVNVTARIEAMNKELTADKAYKILLTSETFDYVSDRYDAEQVATMQLRGRQQETIIYNIVGERVVETVVEIGNW